MRELSKLTHTYLRPYEDNVGVLHDPRTVWDELLKYYKPRSLFLLIGEGSRRMCRPASLSAQLAIRTQAQSHGNNLARLENLEAAYLEQLNRNKYWKRRQRRKAI